MANPVIPMPAHGEHGAPNFDATKTHQLPRFFKELEYLFDPANMTMVDKKKEQLLQYVNYDIEQIWETFLEYEDATKTYAEFKAVIILYYPVIMNECTLYENLI